MPTQPKINRSVIQQQRTACASAASISEEPWAGHYRDLVKQCDDALSSLPADDSLDEKSSAALCSLFVTSNALAAMLGAQLHTLKQEQATALNSAVTAEVEKRTAGLKETFATQLATAVAAELKKLLESGEYVAKATVTQLCSAAETNGRSEGEKKIREELTAQAAAAAKLGERKTALQTAGVALPDAELEKFLGGTDEEFTARRTRFDSRAAELKQEGYALNSELLANLWADDAGYGAFKKLIANIPSLKGSGEPFAGGSNHDANKTRTRLI